MKKVLTIIVLTLILCLSACQNGGGKSVNQKGANVFPASSTEDSLVVTMGDVMPFYDNGVMNVYHLRNSTGTNSLFYHPIARISTSDFIHYTDNGIALDFEEDVTSVDAALGTGSFIKDSKGDYHCFYTGHNDNGQSEGLKYNEVVRHAVSHDGQKTWQKDEDFLLYGYENDFRDPYVYYDAQDELYYMLVTTRDYGNAVIRRFSATSLSATSDEWAFVDNFFTNDEGSYNMECPSFIEYNGFYYLAYSEQGDNRVTHYRYKTSHDGEWKKFSRDSIDASGFYAGRLEKAGDKLYAFAWCARLSGGSSGGFDWGGNLVTNEIRQAENGELFAVMPETYKNYFSHEVSYKTSDGKKAKEFSFDGESFKAYALEKLSPNVTRISTTIKVNGNSGNFGLSFGISGLYDNRLGSAVISFDLANKRLVCFNGVSNILRYGTPLTQVAFEFESGKEYKVDVIIDGEILTTYLNEEVALTSRITDMAKSNFAFYSNGSVAEFKEVEFYE